MFVLFEELLFDVFRRTQTEEILESKCGSKSKKEKEKKDENKQKNDKKKKKKKKEIIARTPPNLRQRKRKKEKGISSLGSKRSRNKIFSDL